jgi:predicted lipoprotein
MRYPRHILLSLLVASLVGVASLSACSDDDGPANNAPVEDPEAAEARRAVLSSLGEDVILATYAEFEQKTDTLASAADAYAGSQSDADRQAVQDAWREAMNTWQRAEMFLLGPAGPMGAVVGGEDLRDQIYSWPIVNPCRVDQELVEQNYTDAQSFASEPVNVRGLDAMEYLLFVEGTENACAPNSSINTDGSWEALSADDIASRRAAYAQTLAANLAERAGELRQMWAADGGNFLGEFSTAGADSETYATSQEALNAVSDAMFYLDKETKDMKLAQPTGLIDCVEDVCPEERESLWADHSLANVRNNLVGFQQLLTGNEDVDGSTGINTLLRDMGAGDLADDLNARIEAAIAAVDAVDGTMAEALQNDPQSVIDVYDATKSVTDLFKSQFFDVLDLEVPKRGEGDND